jgi:LacI family transcriptional regulator
LSNIEKNLDIDIFFIDIYLTDNFNGKARFYRMSPQTTLKDIADKLKVSKVTVSKALRDHPDISEETKRQIRETAQNMGYTPNYLARNLSTSKSNTIGLVVPKIAHHFFATAIETIYSKAFESGYEIMMTVSQEDANQEITHINTLLSMRVDGLLGKYSIW